VNQPIDSRFVPETNLKTFIYLIRAAPPLTSPEDCTKQIAIHQKEGVDMRSLCILTLVLALLVPGVTDAQDQGIKIGTLLPLTGALKDWGPGHQNAVELAARQMVSAGFPMELIHQDSQTSAEAAQTAAQQLVDEDKVVAIVGAVSSGVTIPVAESVTCPKDILMISNGSTSPLITDLPADKEKDFLFRTCPSDTLQGVTLGSLAAGLYNTASVIYVNNPYGRGLAQQFRKSFEKRGGKVLALEPHDEKVASSYMSELKNVLGKVYLTKPFIPGTPDVLCVFSYPEHAKIYLREAIENFKCNSFLFCDGSKSEEIAAVVGAERLEGMMGTAPGSAGGEPYAKFYAAYESSFGELPTHPFIANAYDATAVIGLAAYAAKVKGLPLTSKNIRDYLRFVSNPPGTLVGPSEFKLAFELLENGKDINYEGASGSVNFNENGDVVAPIEIWKFSNGSIVTYRMEYQIPKE
jgi:ABC-type branched-subunit amino acid transport system substrate-binding protein